MLGDAIESALTAVGITKERVEKFLGKPCGCEERKQKLNAVHAWASRVIAGKRDRAKEYLRRIIGEKETSGVEDAENAG